MRTRSDQTHPPRPRDEARRASAARAAALRRRALSGLLALFAIPLGGMVGGGTVAIAAERAGTGKPADAVVPAPNAPGPVLAQSAVPDAGAGGTAKPPQPAASPPAPATGGATPPADPVDVELAPSALEREAADMAEEDAQPASTTSSAQWLVDRQASRVGFRLDGKGGAVEGTITEWRAGIVFDPDALSVSTISVVLEMVSASVEGAALSEVTLLGPDGLYTAYFGAAEFRSDTIRSVGGDAYEADGTLTIKGIGRPLTLPFTLTVENGSGKASGRATIDRTDYQITFGEAGASIAKDVTVTFEIVAEAPAS